MNVLKQYHQKQGTVARLLDRVAPVKQRLVKKECNGADHQRRTDDAFDHDTVKNRLAGRTRALAQFIALARFKRERDVLNAVRYQVEPQQLHREQGQRQLGKQCQREQHQLRGTGRDQQENNLAHVRVRDAPFLDT